MPPQNCPAGRIGRRTRQPGADDQVPTPCHRAVADSRVERREAKVVHDSHRTPRQRRFPCRWRTILAHMLSRRRPAAAVATLLLSLTACGPGTASGPGLAVAPTRTVLMSGPGTPIADGFVVAPDSKLVGVAFPQPSGGWVAVLSVDANPLRVVDGYLAQAAAH